MSAVVMHKDLINTLGSDAIAYSAVTLYLCAARSQIPDDPHLVDEQIEVCNEINEAITTFLAEPPFSSIKDINSLAHISKTPIHTQLMQVLKYIMPHLQWMPYVQSESQKRTKMEMS
jgi:hypothetical protein